jgi:fermentation-respiration switch protein FrsA (DUF1100 family)
MSQQKVTFNNNNWDVAAILQFPENFDKSKKYSAIVCAHPISSCKEQTSGHIYGKKLAEAGFVTLAFDAFHLAEYLLTQPLMIIIGDKVGAFGSYRDGYELFNKAASTKKYLHVVKGASHYDLYDQPKATGEALEHIIPFFKENL